MAEPKTKPTNESVKDFLNTVISEEKWSDSFVLLELFEKITGEKAVMWGASIIGFGKYHYKSERSMQEGDWPITGFSPRKQNLTRYIMDGDKDNQDLLKKLGKHKVSKGCLYIKRLSDVDINILKKLIELSFQHMKQIHADKKIELHPLNNK